MSDIVISKEIKKKIFEDINSFGKDIRKQDPEDNFNNILNGSKNCPISFIFSKFTDGTGKKLEKLKYLEIGVGYGFSLINSIKETFDVVGIEPGSGKGFEGRHEIAKALLKANGIVEPSEVLFNCSGEKMDCFKDNFFDAIYSFSVLEHVEDINKVLVEANRVLKKDGFLYMNMPNYNSFEEQHYNIFWIPFILNVRKIAKFYVRLKGRKDYYIDELKFTTPQMINKIARNVFENEDFYLVPSLFNGFIRSKVAKLYLHLQLDLNDMEAGIFIKILSRNKFLKYFALPTTRILNIFFVWCCFPRTFNLIYFKKK